MPRPEIPLAEIDRLVKLARDETWEGRTLGERLLRFESYVEILVRIINTSHGTESEKKAVMLQAAEKFYRRAVEPIVLPWATATILEPILSAVICPVLSWLIDIIVARNHHKAVASIGLREVYVAIGEDFRGSESILGVFSTREAADKCVEDAKEESRSNEPGYGGAYVEEHYVDKTRSCL